MFSVQTKMVRALFPGRLAFLHPFSHAYNFYFADRLPMLLLLLLSEFYINSIGLDGGFGAGARVCKHHPSGSSARNVCTLAVSPVCIYNVAATTLLTVDRA